MLQLYTNAVCPLPQGRGSHSGLCASSLIGAFPSRIPSRMKAGRVPNSRHRHPSSTFLLLTTIVTTGTKLPRVPFDRHGNCHAARRERTTLAERSERVQVPESSDPEERRAE